MHVVNHCKVISASCVAEMNCSRISSNRKLMEDLEKTLAQPKLAYNFELKWKYLNCVYMISDLKW
jgi:hypothetical protein